MADAINLLITFLGSDCQPLAAGSVPQLATKDQGDISGLATVARYITQQSPKASQLLGSTPEEAAQVDEWLTWATTELQPLVDEKLVKVNDWLLTRTFLVGQALSLADIMVFGVVHPAAVSFPAAQTLHFSAMLRWFDLIQYQTCSACSFPKSLTLAKAPFVAPAAPPPPPPKEAKAAAAPTAAAVGADSKKASTSEPSSSSTNSSRPKGGKKDSTGAATEAAPAATAAAASAATPTASPAAGDKESKPEAAGAASGDAKSAESGASKKEGKKEAKAESSAKKGAAAEELHIGLLDIRVGTIVKVGPHPNAETLYLEEIDLGEEKPRQVISGLVKFVPQDKMEGRRVVVVCNLKPAKMRDIMSYGMVLCASNDTHDCVDPVIPPEGVPNGERITFAGWDQPPLEQVNPKKKILESLFPDMKTDAEGLPNYKGLLFNTSKGPITATIPNAHVA